MEYFKQTGFICDNVQKKMVENICNPSKSYVQVQFEESFSWMLRKGGTVEQVARSCLTLCVHTLRSSECMNLL